MPKKRDRIQLWLPTLFLTYLLLLVWLVLFKLDFVIPHRPRGINFIPFYYQNVQNWRIPFREATANVIAFLPMGIYLRLLRVSGKKSILIGAAVSLAFEVTQFVFAMGIADVTDLLTNTLGTMCGVGLYLLACRLASSPEQARKGTTITVAALTGIGVMVFSMRVLFYLFMYGLLSMLAGNC